MMTPLLVITLVAIADASIDIQVEAVVRSCETNEVREMVQQARKDLCSNDEFKSRKAVYLVTDVGPRSIIANMLATVKFRDEVMGYGHYRRLGTESLPQLYTILVSWYYDEPCFYRSGNPRGRTSALLVAIGTKLGVPHEYHLFRYITNEAAVSDLRMLLETAKKQKTLDKPLDDLISTIREAK